MKYVTALTNKTIHSIKSNYGRGEWIVFLDEKGKTLFQVEAPNLFDGEGNHFDTSQIQELKR